MKLLYSPIAITFNIEIATGFSIQTHLEVQLPIYAAIYTKHFRVEDTVGNRVW